MAMQSQIKPVDPDQAKAIVFLQLQKSEKVKEALAPYRQDIMVNGKPGDYDRLMNILDSYLESKTIEQNNTKQQQRHTQGKRDLSVYGAAAAGGPTPKPNKADCTSWVKFGNCNRGDRCSFTHDPAKKGSGRGRSSSRDTKGKGKGK